METGRRPVHATEYVAPQVDRMAFHCPFCGVYAQQSWTTLEVRIGGGYQFMTPTLIQRSACGNCRQHTYWLAPDDGRPEGASSQLLWPVASPSAPAAHIDMPGEPRADYEEARSIVQGSPRGAVALLRLAVQKLVVALGRPGKDLNADIGALVKQGLPMRVQQALDTLRVTGNNAVHPGQIDLTDDLDRAVALFGLMNYIVEQQITQPKELNAIYDALPQSSLSQIEERDADVSAT